MTIEQVDKLESLYKEPSARAIGKEMTSLDPHARTIIAHSPFLLMATSDAAGRCDVSPKGDAPGFVAVENDTTLLVPDRPGNNRLDGLRNMLENPHVGLLFLVPGVDETLRVNGKARIIDDPERLATLAVNGRAPTTALEVSVEQVFLHCPKAFIRSGLWDLEKQVEKGTIPSMGRMLADQIGGGLDAAELDRATAEAVKNNLY